jgi:hypothetical protein
MSKVVRFKVKVCKWQDYLMSTATSGLTINTSDNIISGWVKEDEKNKIREMLQKVDGSNRIFYLGKKKYWEQSNLNSWSNHIEINSEELMDFEDEIVGEYISGEHHKMGGNGMISAMHEILKKNSYKLADDIEPELVLNEFNWR